MTTPPDPATSNFFGLYRGRVVNNVDATGEGRVQVEVPDVAPQSLEWAQCVGGQRPDVGDQVFVSFEVGDPRLPVVLGPVNRSPTGSVLPAGITLVVDEATGSIELRHPNGTVVSVHPGGGVSITSAVTVEITAPAVNLASPLVKVSGVLHAQVVIAAEAVTSPVYSPGVGNIW
jgi:phage baseplate assembly protein gpV